MGIASLAATEEKETRTAMKNGRTRRIRTSPATSEWLAQPGSGATAAAPYRRARPWQPCAPRASPGRYASCPDDPGEHRLAPHSHARLPPGDDRAQERAHPQRRLDRRDPARTVHGRLLRDPVL